MNSVISMARPKDMLPVAREFAAEAKKFLPKLETLSGKTPDKVLLEEMKPFARDLQRVVDCTDLGLRLERVMNRGNRGQGRRTSAEVPAFVQYALGHCRGQQETRAIQLLKALIELPSQWEPAQIGKYA